MKNAQLRLIFTLASLCTIGIITAQIYGVRSAYNQENERFDLNVTVALKEVAFKVWDFKQSQSTIYNVVNRTSSDYYLVKINENVDEGVLEYFLKESFANNGVFANFVFGLHDCLNNSFKYQKFVSVNHKNRPVHTLGEFPDPGIDNYYFVVYFPYRSGYLASQLTIWAVSSVIILCTLAVLCYVIFVVLDQKRLSEMQKDFVKNMTHEFKTPLTSIQLASTVIKRPNIVENPTKLLNYASIIDAEARKLQVQVERVLQMSMGQKRELVLKMERLDMREVIRTACDGYAAQLEAKDGRVSFDWGLEPIWIEGDYDHLKTAFSNLIDNAIKYTPEDVAPQINISIRDNYRGYISIYVRDKGVGIAKDYQDLIFERFYRVSTGNVHNVKGFGIGLNYVKSIIVMHKGSITCSSTVGQGTTFKIKLPKPKQKASK